MEYQYEDFRKKYFHDPKKIVNILYKSLLKTDGYGHAVAKMPNFNIGGFILGNKTFELKYLKG